MANRSKRSFWSFEHPEHHTILMFKGFYDLWQGGMRVEEKIDEI